MNTLVNLPLLIVLVILAVYMARIPKIDLKIISGLLCATIIVRIVLDGNSIAQLITMIILIILFILFYIFIYKDYYHNEK